MSDDPALILFAKSPLPGKVKTRLAPEINSAQAAVIAAELIELSLGLVTRAWPGQIELHVWPDASHPLLLELGRRFGVAIRSQGEGDLGQKMLRSLSRFNARGRAAAVMGCDVPQCPPHVLADAYAALTRGDDVIGPCSDGGYYLIGLQRARPEFFVQIPWGERQVLRQTEVNAEAYGVCLQRLELLNDIDSYQDLKQAAELVPTLSRWII